MLCRLGGADPQEGKFNRIFLSNAAVSRVADSCYQSNNHAGRTCLATRSADTALFETNPCCQLLHSAALEKEKELYSFKSKLQVFPNWQEMTHSTNSRRICLQDSSSHPGTAMGALKKNHLIRVVCGSVVKISDTLLVLCLFRAFSSVKNRQCFASVRALFHANHSQSTEKGCPGTARLRYCSACTAQPRRICSSPLSERYRADN